jgi:hypothetical protein
MSSTYIPPGHTTTTGTSENKKAGCMDTSKNKKSVSGITEIKKTFHHSNEEKIGKGKKFLMLDASKGFGDAFAGSILFFAGALAAILPIVLLAIGFLGVFPAVVILIICYVCAAVGIALVAASFLRTLSPQKNMVEL